MLKIQDEKMDESVEEIGEEVMIWVIRAKVVEDMRGRFGRGGEG